MKFMLAFSADAENSLADLHEYIARFGSPDIADRFTEGVILQCESMCTFPLRGTPRDDIRPGVRITHYRKRVTIAYTVEDGLVTILDVFYGGQDYEAILRDDTDD